MKKRCYEDKDNKLILENKELFQNYHNKIFIDNINIDDNLIIIIPVTINICLTNSKYSIDFIKYSKYIIDVLNQGFSGTIKNKYKSPEYSETFFSIIANNQKYGKIIYDYINYKFDSNIRFKLDSIIYHNKNFETEFSNADTELLLNNFIKQGFIIKNEHMQNLHINIIKFNCTTLGVSTFPWNSILNNNSNLINYPMQVFIDYKTIHPDLSSSKFNNSRTIIHEVGHIFGLKHVFNGNIDTLETYKIILGNKFFYNIFNCFKSNKINLENSNCDSIPCISLVKNEVQNIIDNIIGVDNTENNLNIYPDIIGQKNPTIKNPIEKKKFVINDDIPVNFACFMDYSPDEVLTHFTLSQCKIMRTIIYIYKNYLINFSEKNKNYEFDKINLYLPDGYIVNFKKNKKFSLSSTAFSLKQFIYPLNFKDNFNYSIKNKPKIIEKLNINNFINK